MILLTRKKIFLIGAIPLLILLLSGCPYDSKVPLIEPENSTLDSKLLGKWLYLKKDAVFEVSRKNNNEYLIIATKEGEDPETMQAYGSKIKGTDFLSIYFPLKKNKAFCICKYNFENDLLRIDCLEKKTVNQRTVNQSIDNSESLRSFVKANIDTEGVFEKTFLPGDLKKIE